MKDIEAIKQRCKLELKGQEINNFETPHYVLAHNDRVVLLEENKKLKDDLEGYRGYIRGFIPYLKDYIDDEEDLEWTDRILKKARIG